MKKYKVRLEFDIISTDFVDVEVFAKDEGEARLSALNAWYKSPQDYDMYAGDYYDTSLSENFDDFVVEEVK